MLLLNAKLYQRLIWTTENIEEPGRSILKWMTAFLTDKEIRIIVKGIKSKWRALISTVQTPGRHNKVHKSLLIMLRLCEK